jgi:hypothetical protein
MLELTSESCYASIQLRENVVTDEEFVLTVNADKQDLPFAFPEAHPTLPNQKTLMAFLVPKFSVTPDPSEIVFVIDRSGSMEYKKTTHYTISSGVIPQIPSVGCTFHFNIIWR